MLILLTVAGPIALYGYVGGGNTIEIEAASLRYRLLIAGSPIESMPLLEAEADHRYFYAAQDGTAPETTTVAYFSRASAAQVLDFYRAACLGDAFGPNGTVAEEDESHIRCDADDASGHARVIADGDDLEVVVAISGS